MKKETEIKKRKERIYALRAKIDRIGALVRTKRFSDKKVIKQALLDCMQGIEKHRQKLFELGAV